MTIDFHADDFGLFQSQSERIIQCHTEGVLSGISVITNGDSLQECLALIRPIANELLIAVHLNFLQGHSLSRSEEVDLLTDDKGIFNISFGKLLMVSYIPVRNAYKQQLKTEIRAQISVLQPFLAEFGKRLRLDGHAHWHMIPVVYDALMEVIEEDKLDVEYIRFPSEPAIVMLRNLFKILPFHPVNVIKTLVLQFLVNRNRKKYRKNLSHMEHRLFTGVLLSGYFSYEKTSALLPDLQTAAELSGQGVELLAHPGLVLEKEDIRKITNRQDAAFFTASARQVEAEMLKKTKIL
jgi:predicted glycoside hydrolase/deacetylase ChbG (UPF0249 family)